MCNCALHDASPLVIESVTGAVTQQDRDPGSHFQIVVFCLFVCHINGSMLRFNGDFSIYNPFAQFNFWSMSPHCTGKIFNPTAHFTSGGAAFSFTLRSTRNGHFSSVLSLGAFMICACCIEKEFSILWRISYQTVLYLSLFTCNTQ